MRSWKLSPCCVSGPVSRTTLALMHTCSPPQLGLVVALTNGHYSQSYSNGLCQHCQPAPTSLSTGSITNICILPATPAFPHTRMCVCWDNVAWKACHITWLVVWTSTIPEQANGKQSIIDTRCNLVPSLHWPPRSLSSCLWLVSMVKADFFFFFLLEEVKNLLSSSLSHSFFPLFHAFPRSLASVRSKKCDSCAPSSEMRCC